MHYFGMPARGVADDTQSASVRQPHVGARRSEARWTWHLGGKLCCALGLAVALSEGGRPGVCSDDGQLGIGRSNDIGRIRLALLKSFGALRVRAVNSIVAAR